MAGLEIKNAQQHDERRSMSGKGEVQVVKIGDHSAMAGTWVFVCVANSGRSVMAERLFNDIAHGRHLARSAGSQPGPATHPVVLEALLEVGIDASDHQPASLDDERIGWADIIVATCDDACPVVPGKRYISWDLPDPKGKPLDAVRGIRDEIDNHVKTLSEQLEAIT